MSPVKLHNVSLPTVISFIMGSLVVLLLLSYVIFQARLLIAGPKISLTGEPEVVQSDRQISLSGTTENITSITLNDRSIVTTEAGLFEENIVLENGYNIVSLKAKDRYGRETKLERTFVYSPLSLYQN